MILYHEAGRMSDFGFRISGVSTNRHPKSWVVRTNMDRRSFLYLGSGLLAAPFSAHAAAKKKIAAVVTMYTDDRRLKSHAAVIVGRMLNGYEPNGVRQEPRTNIVSMYTDQVPANDLSRGLAAEHGFKIFPTVREALTLGGDALAVDGVLFVGEHGDYPTNDVGQKLYPRFELFQQIVEVFRRSKRMVPVFSDKHLSYSWEKAHTMYEESSKMRFPLMAGSSMPLTVREPALELPLDAPLERAISVGYGDIDAYGFHTLEVLQCMVERRRGAEKGISAVQFLEGDAVWKWRDSEEGNWSAPLLTAALSRSPDAKQGPPEQNTKRPVVFLLEYSDGFQAASYMLDGHVRSFLFAAKLKDRPEPVSTHFGPLDSRRPLVHFDGLVYCIEEMFVTGRPLYPVERTLLTGGALSFLFESRRRKTRIETPELKIVYRAPKDVYYQKA
jgi:hypothetical protein